MSELRRPPGERSIGIRLIVLLSCLLVSGTALLVLPLPEILAHATPNWAHVFSLHPVHH